MSDKILTRMGDGERVRMTPSEIKADIQAGTADDSLKSKSADLSVGIIQRDIMKESEM